MLTEFSNQLADVVDGASPSIVQVQGSRRPASGVIFAPGLVLTTARTVGRAERPRVRAHDGTVLEGEIGGWDPTTRLAVVRVADASLPPLAAAPAPARVGHVALALARSWSNNLTASAGIVSVIGGPLPTGHRRAIEQVIRTTAPMHEGFAGGAFLDTSGQLLGIATAAAIRGLGVVIPSSIALAAASEIAQHGTRKRGYLGIAAQPVSVTDRQREAGGVDEALLVVAVRAGSPAAASGLLVGDVVISLDGQPLASPEDLLDLLAGDRARRPVTLRLLRGGTPLDVSVTIAERTS